MILHVPLYSPRTRVFVIVYLDLEILKYLYDHTSQSPHLQLGKGAILLEERGSKAFHAMHPHQGLRWQCKISRW